VTEDEPQLLRFYKIFLEELGYDVVIAADGQECLNSYAAARNNGEKSGFDLVILDYRMPKKNGMEVANELATIMPSQKVLMITAYAGTRDLTEKPENLKIMAKPFELAEFESQIKNMLAT
jgi:two-component system cell cycle response regulator CpdR